VEGVLPKKHITWIKWFLDAWLSSLTRMQTDLAARGLYRDFLDFCYLEGGIPADRDSMIRIAACTPEEFDTAWPQIKHKFEDVPGRPGWLIMSKVTEVLSESGYSSEQKIEAGRLGATARWQKCVIAHAIPDAIAPVIADANEVSDRSKKLEVRGKSSEVQTIKPCASPVGDPRELARLSVPFKEEKSKAIHGKLTPEQEFWFTEWWSVYWRRIAKKPARDAFRKHVTTATRFREVLAATKAQSPEMLSREAEFQPFPATWLNGERWNDEPHTAIVAQVAKPTEYFKQTW
jgi:hypothetical protein